MAGLPHLPCSPSSGGAGDQGPSGLKDTKWADLPTGRPANHWLSTATAPWPNPESFLCICFQKLGDPYLINVFRCNFPKHFLRLSAIYYHHTAAILNASDKILLPDRHFVGPGGKQWI